MFSLLIELFRSVELVWALWLAGTVAAVFTGRYLWRGRRGRFHAGLHRCEAGAAYTLSYMITIPFFALIICLVIDMTLILVAKIGTVYAAYAAARSAVVWYPSGVSQGAAQGKVDAAARHAMTPFASGSERHRPLGVPSPVAAAVYYAAHRSFADDPAPAAYMGRKFQYASWATEVNVDAPSDYRRDVTVTVDYKAPFHMPGIGRILGTRSLFGFYFTNIRTVVKLENQAPRSDVRNPAERPLGISYVPAVD